MIGLGEADDAGVFALEDGRVLIQTIDIFTPVVDDPYSWGAIAAANALSDVYAMGASPLTALNYLAWPRDQLPFEVASRVLQGGLDKMREAGCTVVGGHSVDSEEPSFGFAVTGISSSGSIVSLAGAQPGDRLVLTKPLGIGVITTAIKRGFCPESVADQAIAQMATLNDLAGEALVPHGASAATDVTGFGLIGHLVELCDASGAGAVIEASSVPILEGAAELLDQGAWAGGSARNLEFALSRVEHDEVDLRLLADAQTSGGLLVAIGPDATDGFLRAVPGAVDIGRITEARQVVVS